MTDSHDHEADSTQPEAAPLQPWLHDLVCALAAPTQLWCGPDGQVRHTGAQGVYHGDVRVLARAELLVGGRPPEPVLAAPEAADRMVCVSVARNLGDATPDPTVRVERRRRVSPGAVEEEVVLRSTAHHDQRPEVRLLLASDLAGMDEVKSGGRRPTVPPRSADTDLAWHGEHGLVARVSAPGAALRPVDGGGAEAVWVVDVPAGGEARLAWRCTVDDPGAVLVAAPARRADTQTWRPVVESDDRRLSRWVERATGDLEALRLATSDSPGEEFLAAGAPWYLTLFGRDSLWAARMLLPLGTDLAESTLRVLASRQGTKVDPGSAEQPGKILHELRRTGTRLPTDSARTSGALQLPPVYYGTVDATALWVCLLHDAWRWGLPAERVEPLLPALEAALTWIVEHGDADGDGFLEYVDTTGHGLSNQGWKDSADSVRWRDGSLAEPPIALCEPQGYAHEAAVGGAAVLEAFGRPGADRWLSWADTLRQRFRTSFWVEDAEGAYPAIALDAAKRPVDSLTSNPGHLLGTGLLDAEEEALVARRMASPAMSEGFGLRTLAAGAAGFSPLSYHGGSVWPHDTAIVLDGLARGGHTAAAAELVEGLLTASEAFDGRLPELYGGDARGDVPRPVPYPASCRPQAWSATAAVAVLSAVVGLRADVPGGRVRWTPMSPSPVGAVRVSGLRVAGAPVEASLTAEGRRGALAGCDLPVG